MRSLTVVDRMIGAARAATRCRHAILETQDADTIEALNRAADRYSQNIEALAEELIYDGSDR